MAYFDDIPDIAALPSASGNSLADYLRKKKGQDTSPSDVGIALRDLGNEAKGTAGGLVGLAGDVLGSNATRDWGYDVYQRNMADLQARQRPQYNIDYLTSPDSTISDWIDALQYHATKGLGNVGESLLTGGAGSLLAKQGMKALAKEAIAKEALKKIGERGFYSGVGAQALGMELGQTYGQAGDEAIANGGTLADVDTGRALGYGSLAGAAEFGADIAGLGLARALPGLKLEGFMARGGIPTRAAKGFAVGAPTEGLTEGLQQYLETKGAGGDTSSPEYYSGVRQAAFAGALGGGFAGGLNVLNTPTHPREPLPEPVPTDRPVDLLDRVGPSNTYGDTPLDSPELRQWYINQLAAGNENPQITPAIRNEARIAETMRQPLVQPTQRSVYADPYQRAQAGETVDMFDRVPRATPYAPAPETDLTTQYGAATLPLMNGQAEIPEGPTRQDLLETALTDGPWRKHWSKKSFRDWVSSLEGMSQEDLDALPGADELPAYKERFLEALGTKLQSSLIARQEAAQLANMASQDDTRAALGPLAERAAQPLAPQAPLSNYNSIAQQVASNQRRAQEEALADADARSQAQMQRQAADRRQQAMQRAIEEASANNTNGVVTYDKVRKALKAQGEDTILNEDEWQQIRRARQVSLAVRDENAPLPSSPDESGNFGIPEKQTESQRIQQRVKERKANGKQTQAQGRNQPEGNQAPREEGIATRENDGGRNAAPQNAQVTQEATNAVPEQGTTQGVLRQEGPQVGLPEVGEGNRQEEAPRAKGKRKKQSAELKDAKASIATLESTKDPAEYTHALLHLMEVAEHAEDTAARQAAQQQLATEPKTSDEYKNAARRYARIQKALAKNEDITKGVSPMLDDGEFTNGYANTLLKETFATGEAAIEYLSKQGSTPYIRALAKKIAPYIKDVYITYLRPGDTTGNADIDAGMQRRAGAYVRWGDTPESDVFINLASKRGNTEETLLHELFHAATENKLEVADDARSELNRLRNLMLRALNELPSWVAQSDKASDIMDRQKALQRKLDNVSEFITYAYTNPHANSLLQYINADGEWVSHNNIRNVMPLPKNTLWTKFVDAIRGLFGLPKLYNQKLSEVLSNNRIARQQARMTMPEAIDTLFNALLNTEGATLPAETTVAQRVEDTPTSYTEKFTKFVNDLRVDAPDMLHRFGTGLMSNDQLNEQYSSRVEHLSPLIRAINEMAREQTDIGLRGRPIVEKWITLPEVESKLLSKLQADTTLTQIDPRPGKDNSHVTPKNRAQITRLQNDYKNLSTKAQSVYDDSLALFSELWETRKQSLISNIKTMYDGRIAEATKNKNPDAAARLTTKRDYMLAELKSELPTLKGPYFPLVRFGDWVVVGKSAKYRALEQRLVALDEQLGDSKYATDEASAADRKTLKQLRAQLDELKGSEGDYYVAHVDKRSQAQELTDQLRQKGYEDARHIRKKDYYRETSSINRGFLNRLEDALDALPQDKAVRQSVKDLLGEVYIQSLPDKSAMKAQLRRMNVAGFEQDMLHSFSVAVQREAHHISRLRHNDDIMAELNAMSKSEDADAVMLYNEMNRRVVHSNKWVDTPWQDFMSSANFLHYLGSPAFVLMNLLQTHMIAMPLLAAKFGMKRSNSVLATAMKDAKGLINASFEADKNDPSGSRGWMRFEIDLEQAKKLGWKDDEVAMLQSMMRENLIDITIEHDLASVAKGMHNNKAGKAYEKIMKFAMWAPHHVETFNRIATALAAYRLAKESPDKVPGGENAWGRYAKQVVSKSHLNYTPLNRPYWMRTGVVPFAKLIFQFRMYQQGMIYLLISEARRAFKGDPEARAALYGLLGTHMAMTGMTGLPIYAPAMLLAKAFAQLWPDDDEPDPEAALRNLMADLFGAEAGATIAKGLPALAGVDISQKVGLGDVFSPVRFRPKDKAEDTVKEALVGMLGPMGSRLTDLGAAYDDMAAGNTGRALERILPVKLFRDLVKTGRVANEGITTRQGNVLLQPEEVGPWAAFIRGAFGVSPLKESELYEGRAAVARAQQQTGDVRTQLLKEWAEAKMAGKPTAEADAAIADYNSRHPEAGVRITRSAMLKSLKQRKSYSKNLNAQGISEDKRTKPFSGQGRFAAVQ